MKQKTYLLPALALIAGGLLLNLFANAESSDATSGAAEAEADWMVDYDEARKKAGEADKPLLLYFTGSDWCPPCIALDKEVFSKAAFAEYADENLVLVKVDFSPRGQPTSKEHYNQHNRLSYTFRIEGFPTIVLLTPEVDFMTKFYAYREGGAEKYVEHLKSILKGGK